MIDNIKIIRVIAENNFFINYGINFRIKCQLRSKSTPINYIRQLSTFCYRRNYILLLAIILTSLQARGQSEESLLHLLTSTSKNGHDSIYYELSKLNKTSNQQKAKNYSLLAYNLSGSHKHFLLQTKVCYGLAYLFEDMNQPDSAIAYYHKAIQISLLHNFKEWLVYLYNDLGFLHERIDVYDSALHYLTLSYNLASETHNFKAKAISCYNIGLVYSDLENYKEAIVHFKEAIQIKNSNGISKGLNLNLLNLARVLNVQGSYKDATEQLKKVESNCKNGCDQTILADLNYEFGYASLMKNKQEEAYTFFSKALKISRQNNNTQTIANSLFHLSVLSLNHEAYSEALKLLYEAEEIAKETSLRRTLRDVYHQLSIVYYRTATNEEAIRYENLYLHLRDSIFNKTVASNVSAIQLSEHSKQSNAIIKEKETSLWKANFLAIILVLNSLVAFAIIYAIWRALKYTRDTKKDMAQNMLRMLDERGASQRDVFRANLEHDALLIHVKAFLLGPVATLGRLGNVLEEDASVNELIACARKMKWHCANITTVIGNMEELVLVRNLVVTPVEIDIDTFAEDINKSFKKIESFLLLNITIEKSVCHKIKSDKAIVLALISNAIRYFDYANENPVVEVHFDQPEEDVTLIVVKHRSTVDLTTSIPHQSKFNLLTVIMAVEKLKGNVILVERDEYTLFRVLLPTDFTVAKSSAADTNIFLD